MPGDKSISHRALLLAALADGTSIIAGAGDGEDVRATAGLCRSLGMTVDRSDSGEGQVDYVVHSGGPASLVEPPAIVDCANSGTTLRLSAGLVAARPMRVVLDGDASLRRRPVARIIDPLRSMGAVLHARGSDSFPPLTVVGHTPLRAVEIGIPVPSAQVKSAILLAALGAEGETKVTETVATRDHTERMLRARGVPVRTETTDQGATISLPGGLAVAAHDEAVPGDISAASFWLVGASIHPDAELTLRGVGVNPTRRAIIDMLRRMGARIDEDGAAADDSGVGEPRADLTVRSADLIAIDLGPDDVARAIDEIPILCLAATQATGTTTLRGLGELRVKESDRLAGVATGLAAMGARVEVTGDDMVISGPTVLRGTEVDGQGDHRLAMTFAIAGLVADGATAVGGASSVGVSYPTFLGDLGSVRA